MRPPRVALIPLVMLMISQEVQGNEPPPPAREDARLQATFQGYIDELFRREPFTATQLGEHAHDAKLDDLRAEARKATLDFKRATLERLPRDVAIDKLSPDGRIDYEIFRGALQRELWLAENFRPFEDDPRVYGEYATSSIYLLLTQSSLPKEVNLANAIARMEQVPAVLEVARKTLKNPPRVVTETAIRQAEGAVSFYTTDIYQLSGQEPEQGPLGEKAKALVPVLKEYLAFLKTEVLPRSTGEWRIGREKFVEKLAHELEAGIPADEVLADAEREANRVETEMGVIARQLWGSHFPGTVIPPDDAEGRRRMVRRVLDALAADHSPANRLVADARADAKEIQDFIRTRKILTLPDPDQCRIIEMPEFKRGNAVAYLNPAPPLDVRGTSEYSISPPPSDWSPELAESMLREYNRSMLKILTIHEAYPGHYVQLEYSNRCPSLIRKVLSSGPFAEGWAVYTEQMMLDQGYGQGDLSLRLHQLKFYLRAVVNSILDQKLHTANMTDREALDLMTNRAFQTQGEAAAKLIRAKQSSCQLSTYFVGRMAFYRLRQAIQRELGDRFELARFHEAVLAHGTLPVKYLPQLVRGTLGLSPAVRTGAL